EAAVAVVGVAPAADRRLRPGAALVAARQGTGGGVAEVDFDAVGALLGDQASDGVVAKAIAAVAPAQLVELLAGVVAGVEGSAFGIGLGENPAAGVALPGLGVAGRIGMADQLPQGIPNEAFAAAVGVGDGEHLAERIEGIAGGPAE